MLGYQDALIILSIKFECCMCFELDWANPMKKEIHIYS